MCAQPPARGMVALVAAQVLSTVADTALLFVALGVMKTLHYPGWAAPLLQTFFVAAFTLLAPFVGPFADALPKGRVMLLSNALKLAGALAMLAGVSPFLAYGMAGVGAAAYSPAKFGILAELVPPSQLVRVNAVVEAASFLASLAGTVAGGLLADRGGGGALAAVSGIYAASGLANLFIPHVPAARAPMRTGPAALLRDFAHTVRRLYRMPDARFALLGSCFLTGAGATLRLLLFAWVPVALGSSMLMLPAYLSATAVVGIVVGAVLASRFVRLDNAPAVLPAGALLGVALMVLAAVTHRAGAFAILGVVGVCAGYFLVPLNALLQARGRESVGAGHAIAVQNLTENAMMMGMLGIYTAVLGAGVPVPLIAAGFGAVVIAFIAGLRLQLPRPSGSSSPAPPS